MKHLEKNDQRKHLHYNDSWFAWYPVRTQDCGWVWLQEVEKLVDERPEIYQGLLSETKYWILGGYEYWCEIMDGLNKLYDKNEI